MLMGRDKRDATVAIFCERPRNLHDLKGRRGQRIIQRRGADMKEVVGARSEVQSKKIEFPLKGQLDNYFNRPISSGESPVNSEMSEKSSPF